MSTPSNTEYLRRAPFIVVEGVDGSGKSTQTQLLAEWARAQGFSVVQTREPGGTALAEHLRALILDPDVPCISRAELLMLLAARAQHVAEVIAPALHAGVMVISDRFSLSSFAYQGFGRGLPLTEIRAVDAVATGGVTPDMTLLVDVSLEAALARIGERRDRFEGEGRAFLQRVIDGYRQLAQEDPTVRVVDGAAPIVAVQEAIRREIHPVLARFSSAGGYTS